MDLDQELVARSAGLGALLGERDAALLRPWLESLEDLQGLALAGLLRDPAGVLSSMTDQEAVGAAIAVLAGIRPSEALQRTLSPVLPATEGRYGRLEHRAQHARTVLHLIAADPAIRSTHTAPGGAQ